MFVCHAVALRKTAERIEFLFQVVTLGEQRRIALDLSTAEMRETGKMLLIVKENCSYLMRPSPNYFDLLFFSDTD